VLFAEGRAYDQYEQEIRLLANVDDSPIERGGLVWAMKAPIDAFINLGRFITRADLQRLAQVTTKVFGEVHEPSESSGSEYLSSSADKHTHSEFLRRGLASTLLQIAFLSQKAGVNIHEINLEAFVRPTIDSIPGLKNDPKVIASIQNELPILAEAAPEPFLRALESLLKGSSDLGRHLFLGEGFFRPTSPHVYLLWALEILAWNPEYLPRVALALTKLAAIDPGGEYSNRPLESLRRIFLLWNPSTNAPLQARLNVLDQIIQSDSGIAWQLIENLLPKSQDTMSVGPKPRYREFGASDREVLTRDLWRESRREIVARAIVLAGSSADRWDKLIGSLSNIDQDQRKILLETLKSTFSTAPDTEKVPIWEKLRDEIARHKRFQKAQWAMGPDALEEIQEVADLLRPTDAFDQVRWLFGEHYPDLPVEGGLDKYGDAVAIARSDAVGRILRESGVGAVIKLAKEVKLPQFVGATLAELDIEPRKLFRVIEEAIQQPELEVFARSVSDTAVRRFGDEWTRQIFEAFTQDKFSAEQFVTLVVDWPEKPALWQRIKEQGEDVEQLFWQRKARVLIDKDDDSLEQAILKLIHYDNPIAALESTPFSLKKLSTTTLFSLIDRVLDKLKSAGSAVPPMASYELQEVLKELNSREDVEIADIARREYALLPLLGYGDEKNQALHRLMKNDPSFFVEILTSVFRAEDEPKQDVISEEASLRAQIGYRLLYSFDELPGYDGRSEIDSIHLNSWIDDVRAQAVAVKRTVIADQYIGHVLAHAPIDSEDGAWPHTEVRRVIERLGSDEVDQGVQIERYNMRGVHSRAMYEGGDQERELSDQYLRWANVSAIYPRTFALLSKIAQQWKREAELQDKSAEEDRLRYEG
jgi:hypothetical protein